MKGGYAVRCCAAAAASLATAGAATSAGPADVEARTFVVTMENVGFEPQIMAVKSGDRVTWVNKDLFPHTATADDKMFDSRSIAPAGIWTFVASKPGVYGYTCVFHPTMKGIIKVQ
jgi:plastocyanin